MRDAVATRLLNGADGTFGPGAPLDGVPEQRVVAWVEAGVAKYVRHPEPEKAIEVPEVPAPPEPERAVMPAPEKAVTRAPVRRRKSK